MNTVRCLTPCQAHTILDDVRTSVDAAIRLFRKRPEWENRTGGCFCVADGSGNPLLVSVVGDVLIQKAEKYHVLCQEKAHRLGDRPNHETSYESRDPKANQWGGAVRYGGNLIFSFSGFPEAADEAIVLGVCMLMLPSQQQADRILRLATRNNSMEYWGPLALALSA